LIELTGDQQVKNLIQLTPFPSPALNHPIPWTDLRLLNVGDRTPALSLALFDNHWLLLRPSLKRLAIGRLRFDHDPLRPVGTYQQGSAEMDQALDNQLVRTLPASGCRRFASLEDRH
jgi:hypothetical protein